MQYICTTIVEAAPMTKGDAEKSIGRKVNGKHPQNAAGYLITEGNGYKHWAPSKYFSANFKKISEMSFGDAISAMKSGSYVARESWKDTVLWVRKENEVVSSSILSTKQREIVDNMGGSVTSVGCICAYNKVTKSLSYGWTPQQDDMMANDWIIVEK